MAQRELASAFQKKDDPAYFIIREGKRPIVYRSGSDKRPEGFRMGEYQGQFAVCDEKGRVMARAADRLAEFQKGCKEKLMFAVYEESSTGNLVSMKCYVYSSSPRAEFESFKER